MFGKGIRLGRVSGIEIWIDLSWLIVFALVLWSLASGYFPRGYPGLEPATYWIMSAVAAVLLFVSVLLHELSHSFVAQKSGIAVPRITLFIFGGVAQISQEARTPKTDFNIAAAGPVCSFALASVFWIIGNLGFISGNTVLLAIFGYLALINLMLAVFNLIPGFPLDGGRILRAYLWSRWNDVRKATHTVSRIGSGFGIFLILFGILNFFWGNLIGGIWFVFIGMFLNQAAKSGYRMTLLQDSLSGLTVNDVMTQNVISVPATISINELVQNYFYRYLFISFPVVNQGGELIGMVSVKQVKDIPQNRWHEKKVEDIMTATSGINVLDSDDEAFNAFNLLMKNELGRLPVVHGNKLAGIITRRDIMTLLTIRSDLGA